VRREFLCGGTDERLFGPWLQLVRWVVPLCIVLIFLHQMGII
jgi:NSS family neurotransmitter:Na+ symporter